MLKIFINLYRKMHWSAKAIDTICQNLDSNIQGQGLKINVTKLVYNGEFSNNELSLLVRNSTFVAQILCGLSYKV